MQKVKLFKSIESELPALQKEINAWIKASGARIISISGNIAPQTSATASHGGLSSFSASDILVIVLYEK